MSAKDRRSTTVPRQQCFNATKAGPLKSQGRHHVAQKLMEARRDCIHLQIGRRDNSRAWLDWQGCLPSCSGGLGLYHSELLWLDITMETDNVRILPAQRQQCRSRDFLPARHQHLRQDQRRDYQQCYRRDLASP